MADWATVREIASALPGAVETTTYGQPAFKVGGKLFAWLSPDRAAERALAVRVDPTRRSSSSALTMRTSRRRTTTGTRSCSCTSSAPTGDRIEESWLLRAPKRLADACLRPGKEPG